jgi:hypothetical protein
MKIGIPTHMLLQGTEGYIWTACGLRAGAQHEGRYGADLWLLGAWDARDVNCINCAKTKKYKTTMGKK